MGLAVQSSSLITERKQNNLNSTELDAEFNFSLSLCKKNHVCFLAKAAYSVTIKSALLMN